MANNRMYLVHRPTGKYVSLGKRMASGWYGVRDDLPELLQTLFDETERHGQDDYTIALEDADAAPCCTDKWRLGENNSTIVLEK